jgi:hypothetical protein
MDAGRVAVQGGRGFFEGFLRMLQGRGYDDVAVCEAARVGFGGCR